MIFRKPNLSPVLFICGAILALTTLVPPATARAATDVSGTVSYSGSSGRVYLTMFTPNGPMGTSIAAPGPFTIRGVPTGSYLLTAFMDKLGTGSRHESDPAGFSSPITVVTTPVTGVNITLTDPLPLTTVQPPSGLRVFPADGGALISWNQFDAGNGSQADSYSVYWDTTPAVSTASPNNRLDILAVGDKTDLLLGGIANGTYYFIITAKSGTVTSAPSTAFGPVTIGPPAGGFPVSGSVTFPAVANSKPLYLAISDMNGNMYPAYISSAANPQTYTVNGVPNGVYRVFAVIDVDNNGQIGIGDYKTNDSNAPAITVNNSAVSNVDLTLGSQNGTVNVMTAHWKNGTVDSYYLNFEVSDGLKKPVAVTLSSGPNVTGPIDMGLNSGGGFFSMIGIGATVPLISPPDTYLFDVTYSDGSTDTNLSTAITGVMTGFATPVAPVGSVSYSAAPTFSWTAPATPPANGGYAIFLNEINGTIGSVQWDSNQIPLGQTSAVFNFDNRATQPGLTNAKSYDWGVMVFDQQRNYSSSFASFAFPGSAGISPPSLPSAIVGSLYFQQLTASGGNGSYSWSITTGLLPDGLTLDTATGIISGTPTTAGTSNFTVQAVDNATTPFVISLAYGISVVPPATSNPAISINPTGYNFGTVPVSGTASWPLTINNIGTASLNITGITLTGADYSLNTAGGSQPCNSSTPLIVAGGHCTVTVTVAPLTPGFKSGIVTITSNDSATPSITANFTAKTSPQSIAYIYDTDTTLRDEFNTFLTGLGYQVTTVQMTAADSFNFSTTDLILIGHDTSGFFSPTTPNGLNWGTATAVTNISTSNRPILGLGFGGASLFGQLGLFISWGQSWTGTLNDLTIINASLPIFTTPNLISLGVNNLLPVYTNSPANIGVNLTTAVPNVTPIGLEASDTTFSHYSLIEQSTVNQKYLLWGFGGSPATMTTQGQNLFANILFSFAPTPFPSVTNFSVTSSAGPSTSGFISPAGTVSVASGASQTFNITPFTGYHISDVMVDGISQGVISTYTFNNVTANHTIDALFAPDSTAATITGTINYTGSNTGLIYITLHTPNGTLGTSIATPGTYTIRGVPNGTYTINAFMDNLNLGTQVQSSPAGSFTANISGSNVAGLDIVLVDQTPQAPAAPVNVSVAPGDGSVMLSWDPPRGANGVEAADAYDIFWGPTATVSSTNNSGSKVNIPAGQDSPVVIESLTNGSSLFFSVVPKSGGVIGSASPPVGPVTINPATGGNTVSGTVTYSGSTPTGPLYVILVDPLTKGINGAFYTKIATPSFSNAFSISGAPNGSYMVYAIFDQNSDGRFGVGDTGLTSYGAPQVNLAGSGASGISITLNEMNTEANITTNHGKPASGTGEWYNVNGEIGNQLKRAIKVVLTSAPAYMQLSLPLDLGLSSEGGRFNFWGNATTRPTIGDTFTFLVSYADATPDATITASVTGVLDSFPAFLQVSSPVTTVPTFTWGAPSTTPPANYLYSLWVGSTTGGNQWEAWDIPASITSMLYGSTGSTPQPLAVSTNYNVAVSVKDLLGNKAELNTAFTPTQTVATTTYSITALAAPAIGGFISPPGITQVNSGAGEVYFITPNTGYHIADVKVDGASQGAITSYTFTNVTANHTIDVIFAIDTVDISGTISYTGTNSGRIYIAIDTNQGILGTSINAPGAYTIRGLPNGTFPVRVFMDSLNLGTRAQSSPAGSSTVTISGASVTLPDIAITDQPAVTPPAPFGVSASPGDSSVIIDWDKDRPNGVESADAYDIYWDTSAAVSSTAFKGKRTGIPAGFDSPAVIDGLVNGDKLYFIVMASSGGLQSGASIPFGPVTVGTPTGGNSVSGTLTYSGLTPTGPLHIAVVNPMSKGAKGVYFTTIQTPSASNSFTVNGVPDGEYVIYSIIDMNNDKLFGFGDVMTPDNQAPMIQVAGAPLSGIALGLNAMTAESSIRTDHHFSGAVEFFNLEGQIRGQIKRPVMVTVTAAPVSSNLALPMDLGLDTKDGSGNFRFWTGSPIRPNVGDSYTFSVTYSDGSTDSALTASVTGVNDSFPTNPQISAPVTTVPTFSWGAPATPPANYRYSLWAWTNNNNIWDAWDLPKSMNTIVYGATGSMAQPLQIGISYNWNISTVDQNGNRASVSNSFIPTDQGTPLIFWPTPPAITLGTALTASELNATASVPGTFSYTPAAGTVLPAGAQTLAATFTPTDITNFVSATATVTMDVNPVITSTAGTNGTIIPIGATVVPSGSSQVYAITPSTGYHIADVMVDGVSQGAITTYTFNSVTANHTIDATFAIDTFTLTATAGSNGTITPAGATVASYGSNQVYAITPTTGYHIADVKVDGVSQGAVAAYTFNSVAANHTIDATFAIDTFTLTATSGSNGTITPTGATVASYGSSQTYAITPTTGYHITDVKVDGISQGVITAYSFTNVTVNHTIDATFAIDTFTLTATAGSGGAITPAGATVASYGSNQVYAITPTTGYHIVDVMVDGVSQGAIATYPFNSVTANHTIDATFAIDTFTINATANSGGTISPAGATTLNYGASQSYTITPDAGFVLIDVRVDQVSAGKVNSYTINNLTSGHTIEAVFGADGIIDPTNPGNNGPQINDALMLLTAVRGDPNTLLTPEQRKRADVAPLNSNGVPQPDSKIDLGDVLLMLRRVVGLVNW